MEEKLVKIYYGENEKDYIKRYVNEKDILDGYLSEAKAFELFFSGMIICNNYLNNNYDNLDILIDNYNENEDYVIEQFQFFLVEPEFDEDTTIKAVKKMYNTLYFDNKNDLYIMGVTDLGTNRNSVETDLRVEIVESEK